MCLKPWLNGLASRRKSTQVCKTRTCVPTCKGWPNGFAHRLANRYPACRATLTLPSWKCGKRKKALPLTSTFFIEHARTVIIQWELFPFDRRTGLTESLVYICSQLRIYRNPIAIVESNQQCGPMGVLTCLTGLSRQRNWYIWLIQTLG